MSGNSKLLNEDALKNHFAGDEEMIGELLEIFTETYPEVLSEIKTSLEKADFELFERSSHTLKGMVANFFCEEIKNACFELEKLGKSKSTENTEFYIKKIEEMMPQLISEIKLFLN